LSKILKLSKEQDIKDSLNASIMIFYKFFWLDSLIYAIFTNLVLVIKVVVLSKKHI